MITRLPFGIVLAGLLGYCCLVSAEDPKPKFPKNVIPSTFRAFLVTDGRFPPSKGPDGKDKEQIDPRSRVGKIHCLVCENGLSPVIAIFVHPSKEAPVSSLSPDKNVGELISRINQMIAKPQYRAHKLASFVVFLRLEGGTKDVTVKSVKDKVDVETKLKEDLEFPDEDDKKRAEYVEDIKKYANAVNAPNVPFGLAAEKSKALIEWGVEDKATEEVKNEVTVVIYYRMRKVGESFTFAKTTDVTEDKITEILKTAENTLIDTKD